MGDDSLKPDRCKSCNIMNCAKEKGFIYCYECSDFPCKQINNLEKSCNRQYKNSLTNNSRDVQNKGITFFLKNE